MEKYTLSNDDQMPYAASNLTVGDFLKGASIGWTDRDTMYGWNELQKYYRLGINVKRGFEPLVGNCRTYDIFHYFGLAMDMVPKNEDGEHAFRLYEDVLKSRAFKYTYTYDPGSLNVNADNRYYPSNTFSISGLPTLMKGDQNVYVCVLQEALQLYGYSIGSIDGIFGKNTEAAVKKMQEEAGLDPDGIVTRLEWHSILAAGCLSYTKTQSGSLSA